ncbi:MAG TPA: TetR/AcrR family transcriptional regulator [Candidatus Acidoferrales bacterium]|nr:TetR/AcrR family transcriptional regulator [Candidatus Acidoferrales bacterium]
MARTANRQRPVELLDAIVDHLATHGVAELSLRPLAKAVGSSPRVLLYYFGSKQGMVVKALARLRERQRTVYGRMKAASLASPAEACRAIWKQMTAPESEPLFRMFFEAYAMALRHPRRFASFLDAAIEDWLEFLAAPLIRKGHAESEARAHATIVLAGFRGFLLDYCASRDRQRLDRAVDLWLQALEAIPLAKEGSRGD